jgi:hypothetical protein
MDILTVLLQPAQAELDPIDKAKYPLHDRARRSFAIRLQADDFGSTIDFSQRSAVLYGL